MKSKNLFIIFVLLFLCAAPALADNTTSPYGPGIHLLLDQYTQAALAAGSDVANIQALYTVQNLHADIVNGVNSYSWDSSIHPGSAISAVQFVVPVATTVNFNLNYGNGIAIPGSVRWDVSQNYLLLWSTTRTLTLGDQSTVITAWDTINPLLHGPWATECSSNRIDCGMSDARYFYVSAYAVNTTSQQGGVATVNYGKIEQIFDYTQTTGEIVFYPANDILSSPAYSISTYSSGGTYTIEVVSEDASTVAAWNQQYAQLAITGNMTAATSAQLSQAELLGLMVTSIWSYISNTLTYLLTGFGIIIEEFPTIATLYLIITTMLSFLYCKGNMFNAFATWWRYQVALIEFAFKIPTIVENHWQAFLIGGAVSLLALVGGAIISAVTFWLKIGH
jgi:hypothetical protein